MLSTQAGSSGVSMENNKTVNLIWFGESANLWGKSWIEELLKDVDLVYHYPKNKEGAVLLDNCIVVTNNSESYEYIETLDRANKKYAVILLSDETLTEPMFYRRPRRISAIYKKKAGLRAANCYIAAA
jgi:hypothetical protein